MILFVLSTILALYQLIRHIAGLHTDLALQAEHARLLDNRLAAQKDFYEAKVAHEDALRSLRHDMAGHLNTLAALLSANQSAEALAYLNGLTNCHKEQTAKCFSTNPYINAVLQNYTAKCLESHIELICHIGTDGHELSARICSCSV